MCRVFFLDCVWVQDHVHYELVFRCGYSQAVLSVSFFHNSWFAIGRCTAHLSVGEY